jgi:hypothetical protein
LILAIAAFALPTAGATAPAFADGTIAAPTAAAHSVSGCHPTPWAIAQMARLMGLSPQATQLIISEMQGMTPWEMVQAMHQMGMQPPAIVQCLLIMARSGCL